MLGEDFFSDGEVSVGGDGSDDEGDVSNMTFKDIAGEGEEEGKGGGGVGVEQVKVQEKEGTKK